MGTLCAQLASTSLFVLCLRQGFSHLHAPLQELQEVKQQAADVIHNVAPVFEGLVALSPAECSTYCINLGTTNVKQASALKARAQLLVEQLNKAEKQRASSIKQSWRQGFSLVRKANKPMHMAWKKVMKWLDSLAGCTATAAPLLQGWQRSPGWQDHHKVQDLINFIDHMEDMSEDDEEDENANEEETNLVVSDLVWDTLGQDGHGAKFAFMLQLCVRDDVMNAGEEGDVSTTSLVLLSWLRVLPIERILQKMVPKSIIQAHGDKLQAVVTGLWTYLHQANLLECPERYQPIALLGSGSYSDAILVEDSAAGDDSVRARVVLKRPFKMRLSQLDTDASRLDRWMRLSDMGETENTREAFNDLVREDALMDRLSVKGTQSAVFHSIASYVLHP